jgi:hypothetical protein
LFIDGDHESAKERVGKIFKTAPKYEFEIAYETEKREQPQGQEPLPEREQGQAHVQMLLRTELVADTVPGMAVEAVQLLEGLATPEKN